jgi:DNA (cytosine-5)-methyltransferase 1
MSGHSPPRRETRASVAALTANGVGTCGADDTQGKAGHLIHCEPISRSLTACKTATGRLDPNEQEFVAFDCKASGQNGFGVGEVMSTLRSMGHAHSHTNGGGHASVQYGSAVRRLTPRECERLQGFPDDYTLVPNRGKPMADGPRYRALGNSMAVPVMRWIGERISAVEALHLNARIAA